MQAPPTSPVGGDQNGGPAILAISMSTVILATAFVCLRCYIRLRMISSFWWDDAFIILATVLSIAGSAFMALSVHFGAGRHTFYLHNPKAQIPKVVMWNTAYQLDNVISVNMVKVSILLFIWRIQNNRFLAASLWTIMFVMSVVNLVTVAALASQCRPLQKLWYPTVPGTCFQAGKLTKFGIAQGVVNVITDFYCTTLPIVIMWKVKIKLRTKVVICALTSLGLAATASQIVRVVLLNTLEASDYSHDILGIVIAAILDQNLGIIAACIPTFRPLFKSFGSIGKSSRSVNSENRLHSRSGADKQNAGSQTGFGKSAKNAPFKRLPDQPVGRSLDRKNSDESDLPLQVLPAAGEIPYARSYKVESVEGDLGGGSMENSDRLV